MLEYEERQVLMRTLGIGYASTRTAVPVHGSESAEALTYHIRQPSTVRCATDRQW